MNQNPCKICGHPDTEFLLRAESKRYSPGEYFDLCRCKKCNSVCTNPHLKFTAIQKYYPEDYEPHEPIRTKTVHSRELIMKLLRNYIYGFRTNPGAKRANAVRRLLSWAFDRLSYRSYPWPRGDGKLLDIGCGNGAYLATVKELGWEGYGIESDFAAARNASKTLGLEVQTGDFESVAYPEKHFDAITMWHSLEHFPDPKKIIRKVRKLLKDEGLLMIGLPNFSSLDQKLFKESWNGLEIPLHAYHFTPRSIQYLLEETGFEITKILHTTRPTDMMKSFVNLLLDRYRFESNKYLMMILFVISIPISIFFSICRRSSIIKVFAI
jgi:2-polyprenyl-3-methyl-5-hydroxy-6-metoxy-1,4-benzoquinol methylase